MHVWQVTCNQESTVAAVLSMLQGTRLESQHQGNPKCLPKAGSCARQDAQGSWACNLEAHLS